MIVTLVHLLRVILTGSYAPPRRLNYLLGMGLLVLAVLLDFTGYVLRWDEGIHWALVTGTNLVKSIPLIGNAFYTMLVGGTQPGPATLIRFYGWHIFGLTLAAGILVAWHIFRVRRDGGIAVPPPAFRQDQIRISRFELVRREVLAMLLAGTGLLLLSTFAPAPLAAPITAYLPHCGDCPRPLVLPVGPADAQAGQPFLLGGGRPAGGASAPFSHPIYFPETCQDPNWDIGSPEATASHRWLAVFVLFGVLVLTILAFGARLLNPRTMRRYFLLAASFAFLLALLVIAWQESRRPKPVPLTPTLTGQVEYCLTCHSDLAQISNFPSAPDIWLRALSWWRAPGSGCRPGSQHHARR